VIFIPYSNYQDKLDHNRNYVKHYRGVNERLRINLNGIKKRLYVCELCGDIGNTQFHEWIDNNPKEVIEVCKDCHDYIKLKIFDENKLFR